MGGRSLREALLYERLRGERVRCGLCERRCIIPMNSTGHCGTRMNLDGKLYTLVYGVFSAGESRPIEIKPLFHFYPGTTAYTFSTWSCNFDCPWCQNYHLSKVKPPRDGGFRRPVEMVERAEILGDDGVCASFQEPTLLFESLLEIFPSALEKKLYTCIVSNGYFTREALDLMVEAGLQGVKIDVKGGRDAVERYCGGVDGELVWSNAEEALKRGCHVEIVNLLVSGVSDDENSILEVIESHLKRLGPRVPLHFTRYFPAYRFKKPATEISRLIWAYERAKREGILYPYLGNIPEPRWMHTYCPDCGYTLIKRSQYRVIEDRLKDRNSCPQCGCEIPITR
jgi:pyruvate formate lyase activating enzyme